MRNGLIGKITEVEVGLPSGHNDFAGTKDKMQVTPPPARARLRNVDRPRADGALHRGRVHKNWRWNYNIGGGQLLDWIGHHCDIAHWGMDCDSTGPVEMKPISGGVPAAIRRLEHRHQVPRRGQVRERRQHDHRRRDIRTFKMGTKWIGTDGWVWVDRGGFDCFQARAEEGP